MKKLLSVILTVLLIVVAFTACGDRSIESIEIKEGLVREYNIGDTPDFSGVKITATYNDGDSEVVTAADGVTFSSIDTSTAGTKKLTITYDGKSITVDIVVKKCTNHVDADDNGICDNAGCGASVGGDITLVGVDMPASITALSSYKQNFLDQTQGYVVGDDNGYIFELDVTLLDSNFNLVEDANYVGYSLVYLLEGGNETLVGAEYVVIDEVKHSYDFTEAAIGKTFKIVTRPNDGFEAGTEASYTKNHTVTVVDGYNIYNAKELNLITNYGDDFMENDESDQLAVVNTFLQNNGITRPETLAGVVLHNNITIQTTDLPQEFYYTYNNGTETKSEFFDFMGVFYHNLTEAQPTFTIHGNYYTLYTYNLPCVVAKGQANNDDDFSNSALFRFNIDEALEGEAFDHTKYVTSVNNFAIRDNDPNTNDDSESERHMRGLLGYKTQTQTTNFNNSTIEAFFISILVNGDYQTVNLNKAKFYNAWQGHVFIWSDNTFQSSSETPYANHTPVVINITESHLTKCGGPVIMSQTNNPECTANAPSHTDINIDTASTLESFVTGEEAWFKAMGVTPQAMMIKAMSDLIAASAAQQGKTAGYTTTDQVAGVKMMNLIYVNMVSGTNPFAGIDVDGSVTIGGNTIISQNDGENIAVETYLTAIKQALGQDAPIFQSSNGSVAFCDGETGVYTLTAGGPAPANESFFEGDYISLYYMGMGVLLEYYN